MLQERLEYEEQQRKLAQEKLQVRCVAHTSSYFRCMFILHAVLSLLILLPLFLMSPLNLGTLPNSLWGKALKQSVL